MLKNWKILKILKTMIDTFVKAVLIAKKEGIYTTYVFKNLETEEYIMCTKLPNWDCNNIPLNVEGFLSYELAIAGNSYYNPKTENFEIYKYSKLYFKNFIIEDKLKNEEIILI